MRSLKYYVRVGAIDKHKFDEYLKRNKIEHTWMSTDIGPGNGSSVYSLELSDVEASAMRLSFELVGFMNLKKTLDAQVARRAATVL